MSPAHFIRGTLDMPNDAKLGLMVGVGLVIGVAVIYFRKDLPTPPGDAAYAAPVSATRATPANPRGAYRSVKAKAVAEGEEKAGEGEKARGGEESKPVQASIRNENVAGNGVRMIAPIERPDRLP
jgi:hypothetical protein